MMASTSSSSSYSCIINRIKPFFPLSSYCHATCNQIVAPVYCKPFLFPSSATNKKQLRLDVATSVAFNPSGNYEMSLFDDEDDTPRVSPPGPPKAERVEVVINNDVLKQLDISPFQEATGIHNLPSSVDPKQLLERTIGFTINFERESEHDSRELSEYPEIRLWFVLLDATYPWLPVMLDWRGGELARYAAMLVPHQMSMRMGVVFNPEALEFL
uniref:Chlororespiratory reduction 6 n=1 Tax=Kalanchoe fedtschenkoi TaxID=63787 RepID=A0A7N0UED6_KALFE